MQKEAFDKMAELINTKAKEAKLPFFYSTDDLLDDPQQKQLRQMGFIVNFVAADAEFNNPNGYSVDLEGRHREGQLFVCRKGRIVPAVNMDIRMSIAVADEDSKAFQRDLNTLLSKYGARV